MPGMTVNNPNIVVDASIAGGSGFRHPRGGEPDHSRTQMALLRATRAKSAGRSKSWSARRRGRRIACFAARNMRRISSVLVRFAARCFRIGGIRGRCGNRRIRWIAKSKRMKTRNLRKSWRGCGMTAPVMEAFSYAAVVRRRLADRLAARGGMTKLRKENREFAFFDGKAAGGFVVAVRPAGVDRPDRDVAQHHASRRVDASAQRPQTSRAGRA